MPPSSSPLAAVDFGRGVADAWSAVATSVPRLLAFLVVLFIGWLVAKALAKVVDKVLDRVGFDRVVERGGIDRVMARTRYDASELIAKLVYYAVLLIALQVAFSVFGTNPVSTMLTGVVAWLPRAAVAIVIVVVAGAVARAVRDVVSRALGGLSYGSLLGTVASVFVWGLGIIAALNQIGVATSVTTPVLVTVLATVAGIAIVGVGGGLVRPMQQRWEGWLSRAEDELPQARAAAQAYQRGREDAARMSAPRTGHLADTGPIRRQDLAEHAAVHGAGYTAEHTAGYTGAHGYDPHPRNTGYPEQGHPPPDPSGGWR